MDRFPADRLQIPRRRSSHIVNSQFGPETSSNVSDSQTVQSDLPVESVQSTEPIVQSGPGESNPNESKPKVPHSRLAGLLAKYEKLPFTLFLENTALVARDHMANERTYLAWIRTGFVLMSMGIVFTQMYMIQIRATEAVENGQHYNISLNDLGPFHDLGMPLTVLTGVLSIFTMVFGYVRYMMVQNGLQQNFFPATRVMVLLVLLMTSVIVILVLVADINALKT